MLTQHASTVLYAILAASVLFQIVTAARFAARAAWKKRNARRPQTQPAVTAPAPRTRVSRVRRRDYRLALRAARASVAPKA